MWEQICSNFMQLYSSFTQAGGTTRKKILIVVVAAVVLLALAVWYMQGLENSSRVDRNLKALQSQNVAAKKTAAEIMNNARLKEEALALEIHENLDNISDDDLAVVLRGLLLEHEAERRRNR